DGKALDQLAALPQVGDRPAATVEQLTRALYWLGPAERKEAAIRVTKQAHGRQPDHFALNGNLAIYLQQLSEPRFEEALSYWRVAKAVRPQQARVRAAIGEILIRLGRGDEALAEFDKAIELEPKSVVLWMNRALAYQRLHQYEKALADYAKVL